MSRIGVQFSTPRGELVTYRTKGGEVKCKIEWNPSFASNRSEQFTQAQIYVDSEVIRLSDPYVPFDTGVLKTSAQLATEYGSGEVIYNTPYAYRQYHNNKGAGQRGPKWFERMKADHKDEILRGAANKSGGKAK